MVPIFRVYQIVSDLRAIVPNIPLLPNNINVLMKILFGIANL